MHVRWKNNLHTRKKYLQIIHPVRNLYLEYKKKPYNYSKKEKKKEKKTTHFKNGQAIWINISLKKNLKMAKKHLEKILIITSH